MGFKPNSSEFNSLVEPISLLDWFQGHRVTTNVEKLSVPYQPESLCSEEFQISRCVFQQQLHIQK